jgi:uncharacterized protein (TIGR02217 family)
MPSISSAQLHEQAAYHAVGGPQFRTHIVHSANGTEQRNAVGGLHPRRSFTIDPGVMHHSEATIIYNFHQIRRGMWESFRMLDIFDYVCNPGAGGVAYISGNQYQLVKHYTHGAFTYRRPITRPILETVSFQGGSGITLDATTGVITAASPPSGWNGFFHIPVRFQEDPISFNWGGGDQRTYSLSVIEVFDTPTTVRMLTPPAADIGTGPASSDSIEIDSEYQPQPRTHLISPNELVEERFQYGISPAPVIQNCKFLYSHYDALQRIITTFLVARGRRCLWRHDLLGLCRFASDHLICSRIKFDSYSAEVKILRYV